jgi:hypothetical protein
MAENTRHCLPEQKAQKRHQGLEQAKGGANPNASSNVNTAEANSNGARKVAQADRDADQKQAKNPRHAGNYMEAMESRLPAVRSGGLSLLLNKNTLQRRLWPGRIAANLQALLSPKVRPTIAQTI